jgi:hypothetical protein
MLLGIPDNAPIDDVVLYAKDPDSEDEYHIRIMRSQGFSAFAVRIRSGRIGPNPVETSAAFRTQPEALGWLRHNYEWLRQWRTMDAPHEVPMEMLRTAPAQVFHILKRDARLSVLASGDWSIVRHQGRRRRYSLFYQDRPVGHQLDTLADVRRELEDRTT